jgi:hypothetical protein
MASLHKIDTKRAAAVMRQLAGKVATPSHLREEARELEDLCWMKFVEWPSGFWKITDEGRAFLAEHDGNETSEC